ncbi:L-serine dehydratase [Thermodesulfobium acidiphilum]|uniref:L-serine dehydratase n=1 Tax=Thermodesulfobium acidiphilum TaxID=1794699 RepID=A0A2R4W1K4_THEAF|nr:L-serine ammonia-lyase, iron-sulfur-dependent, subunit alpha [Thermodesulfobium acidiphilum]AWB10586.1 L-serine dehydratase [Thermodesulfobium acidiphilum]
MASFSTISELVSMAEENRSSISEIVLSCEVQKMQKSRQEIIEVMNQRLIVMKKSIEKGKKNYNYSVSKMVGMNSAKFDSFMRRNSILGKIVEKAICYALSVSEVNACMGLVVACPTAGSCGILPGAVLSVSEEMNVPDEKVVLSLFTAAGIGMVIGKNATLSGAVGGCQAECGSASAMAAAAVLELMEASPKQIGHAVALALKNYLGLVCDPVAGLVEVPCVKRNAFAAVHALVAAELALAGIESVIPPDEVILASYEIGRLMPKSLKETSEAGLAKTPTGKEIEAKMNNW